jgi:hypothetical protein
MPEGTPVKIFIQENNFGELFVGDYVTKALPDEPADPPEQCPDGQHWDETQGKCLPDSHPCPEGEHWDDVQGECVPDTPGGDVDSLGIAWLVAKGRQTMIEQSRDTETDDRWSGNVRGLTVGFEATMIAKSMEIASDGHFAMKQFGGNHKGPGAENQRWYDTGLRKNGDVQLEWERHPASGAVNRSFNLSSDKQFITNIGKGLEGNWIGLKWCCIKVNGQANGSPSNGGVRVRMWVDTDPLGTDGRPKNNWKLCYDFIDGIDKEVIEPQSYSAQDELDCEVRRSDTKRHEVYGVGLHVRAL